MNNPFEQIPFSLLELGTVKEGQQIKDALDDIIVHAQLAEQLNFKRFWLAEHHNMPTVTTAATAILIGQVARATERIRVGSGGIMLPNHSPLAIAEQFGTLDLLFPNRIDLGLGRAPGTDQQTAAALRRNHLNSQLDFPQDVQRILDYWENTNPQAAVRAFPGEGQQIPVTILGSSIDSAYLAAEMGLPYAFAAHFAPQQLGAAGQIYRNRFKASAYLQKPYFTVACNAIVADTQQEAQWLSSSIQEMFIAILTNARTPLPAPRHEKSSLLQLSEAQSALQSMLAYTFIGSAAQVSAELADFAQKNQADELILTNYIHPTDYRHRALQLLSEIQQGKWV